MVKRIALFALIASVVACAHFENVAALLAYNPSNPSGVTWDQTMVAVVDQGDAAVPTDLVIASKDRLEFVRLDENGTQIGAPQSFPFTVRSIAPSPNRIWILSNDGLTISFADVRGNNVGPNWFTHRVLPTPATDIAVAWNGSAVYAITEYTIFRSTNSSLLEMTLDTSGVLMASGPRAIAFDRFTSVVYAAFPVTINGVHHVRVSRWSSTLGAVQSWNRYIGSEWFKDIESSEDMVVIRSQIWGTSDNLRLYNNAGGGMSIEETVSAPLSSFATVGTLSTTGSSSYAPLTGCDPYKRGGFLWRSRRDSFGDGRLMERRLLCAD